MREDWATAFEDAVIDPCGWNTALEVLAESTGSNRAQLVGFGGTQALQFNWITNVGQREWALFTQMEGHSPTLNFRVAADRMARREIVFEADYDTARSHLIDTDYLDFCEQADMPFGCQTMLVQGEGGAVGMALLRSKRDGRTDETVRDIFRDASRIARTAVRMQVALEQQGALLIEGALEAMSAACLLFDRGLRVRSMTPAAEARLSELGCLSVREERLVADDPRVASQLDQAFSTLSALEGTGHIRLKIPSMSGGVRFDLFRMRRREWSFGFEPCFIGVLDRGAAAEGLDSATLAAAFGFTAAESAIAALLVEGQSRQEIARRRAVTVETLRGQLKTLYGKTGCSREAELVALLAQLRH